MLLACTLACTVFVNEVSAAAKSANAAAKSASCSLTATTPAVAWAEWTTKWWLDRFNEKLSLAQKGDYDIVFVGDSITELHEKNNRGINVWKEFYTEHPYRALNFGFSGDRTENVLWRFQHGGLADLKPKAFVLLIGTNNAGHRVLELESPLATAIGTVEIVRYIEKHYPESRIVWLPIFPRGATVKDPFRMRCDRTNEITTELFKNDPKLVICDFASRYLDAEGVLSKETAGDLLHILEPGYRLWAETMRPYLDWALGLSDAKPGAAAPARVTAYPATDKLSTTAKFDVARFDEIARLREKALENRTFYWDAILLGDEGTKSYAKEGKLVLDLGLPGALTEETLAMIEHGGFLNGVQAREVFISSGAANLKRDSREDALAGVEAIAAAVRKRLPRAKIVNIPSCRGD